VHSQLSAQQTSHHQSAQLYPLQNACVASLPHASDNPINHGSLKTEPLTTQQGFSPFEDPRGAGSYANHHDSLGRTSVVSERMPFNATSESGPYSDLGASNANSLSLNHPGLSLESSNTIGGNTYATGKGSRLAKFFDGKSRDGAPLTAKAQTPPVGFTSSSPIPGQRQDQVSFNGMIGGNSTDRAMDDLFVMLNNSAQVLWIFFLRAYMYSSCRN
jgi:hypothetical protein